MKRTPINERILPGYTRGEEIANMTTHIIGGGLGVVILALCVITSALKGDIWGIIGGAVYGFSMIAVYTVSSVYHGLKPCFAKKVMQVIDHCTIYLLIAGTYTPILLCAMRPEYPQIAWLVFASEWLLAGLGAVFTAIDHNKYKKLSMVFYILMGWFIVLCLKQTIEVLTLAGMLWILFGGISYTIGAVLYGIGKKKPVFHTVFHVFVVIGTLLQAAGILIYVL
ncbi:MAG: hemolysin III family protein [Oscillospiraceae bacterium]|nr:hemolysin III family protein [Oscillospiraceae bacterium]MBQ4117763.1 hemolysin III family protein [Oscillospiraceae bacterium]MBQ6701142.1 hemolysin III family protein [Oscillospiraceae bacterium]MBQ6802110.1 hemolysin III family protein [Oscillospiraceae bacterium]